MTKDRVAVSRQLVSNSQSSFKAKPLSIALAAVIGAAGFAAPGFLYAAETPAWAKGHILVKAAPGLSEEKLAHILSARGSKSRSKIQNLGVHIVKVPPQAEEKVIAALSHNPNIEFAELDMLVPLNATTPSDPGYSSQWHLPQINAPIAWDVSMGDGVTVAIIDTGVNPNHADLANHLLPGFNSVDNSTNSSDDMGHGTAVAGTVGAIANNGTGIASVAWNVSLLPVRVSNTSDGVAQWSDLAEGLTWAADNGAQVANISYSISNSSTLSNAAAYMKSKGGVVVSSAGNSGSDLGYGDNPHIITVSATENTDSITSWSSFGNMVDITAPGLNIYTTNKNGAYSYSSGTSFSSPVVAGVAALVMSANPSLTPDEVEHILESTAKDLGIAGWDNKYGHGRVDAGAAVLAAIGSQPIIDIEAPGVSLDLSDQQLVSGTLSITASATDNIGVTRVEIFVNGSLIATDNNAPFNVSWDSKSVSNGLHTIEALAFDAANNNSNHRVNISVENIVVIDTEAPIVDILSPTADSIVSGNVKINIAATDNDHVAMLSCFVDGRLLAASNDVSNMTCTWNTRKVSAGAHTLLARAEDSAGNTTETTSSIIVGSTSNGGGGGGKGRKK